MNKKFVCKMCNNQFTVDYYISKNQQPMFCSKVCAGKSSKPIHTKFTLENMIKTHIKQKGRYITKKEILDALSVSSKTLSKFSISIVKMNKLAGFNKPHSKGEIVTAKFLDANGIDFEQEKTFSDLVSNKGEKLRFDFYLPNENLLIEIDGRHHKRDYTQVLDQIKNTYCKHNGIRLERIIYYTDTSDKELTDKLYFILFG